MSGLPQRHLGREHIVQTGHALAFSSLARSDCAECDWSSEATIDQDEAETSYREDVRRRIAEVVLFSEGLPDDTPVPKVRELVERLTDITMDTLAAMRTKDGR